MSDTERNENADATAANDRWLGDSAVLDADLPAPFRARMAAFLGSEDVATLGDWVAALRSLAGGGVDADQLCYAGEETAHRAVVRAKPADGAPGDAGEQLYFRCFYDAIALAHLRDERVDVRTESPAGTVVRATATGSDVVTTPADAVVSFGVAADAPTDGDPDIEAAYGAICPYVKAFPDRAAYEAWAADVDAETVGLPLDAGVPVAAALVE